METLILKDEQQEMLTEIRKAFAVSKRVILQAATALGKTVIAAKIIQKALRKNKRCLFICDRINLVLQTSIEFKKFGIHHGIIMSDHPDYFPARDVQIASAATLCNRDIQSFDIIIVDEAHTIHKGINKAIGENKEAYVLGLTASPYTKGLGKIFDFHIQPYTVKQLIERGLLCDYDVYAPTPIDLTHVKTVAGDYKKSDLSDAADKSELTAEIVNTYLKLSRDKKTIVFTTSVAHGRHLEKEFNKRGVDAKEINAYLPKKGEESAGYIIQEFKDNKFKVLLSVEMIVKGFDVPDVECVIFATATKSMIKFTQALGRGLRLSEGKEKALILDHGTNFERLGFPDEFEFLALDDGKHQKSLNNNKEKPVQLPKSCPSCDFLKAPGVRTCPACGFKPEFVQDVEVNDGELEKIKRKAKKEYTLSQKQSFMSQLNQYAKDKNYKRGKGGCYGWSIHKYNDKFGGEPPSRINWNQLEPVGEEVKKFIQYCNIKDSYGRKKMEAKPKCLRCDGENYILTTSNQHTKLSCSKCGGYLKFVSKGELRSLMQYVDSDDR